MIMYNINSKVNCPGGVRKGSWTDEEDSLLRRCIEKHGEGNWHRVPVRAGLNRCRKSCRLRWMNYLKPNIKRGQFNEDEVDLIIRLHKLLGNRWSLIAGRIPGRTANDVKNYWNTHLIKKLSTSTRAPKHTPSTSHNPNNNNNNNNMISKEVTTCGTKTTRTMHPKIIKPQPWSFPKRPGPSVAMGPPTSSHNGDDDGDGWWEKLVEMYDQKEEDDDEAEDEEEEVMNTNTTVNGLNNNNNIWPTFTTSSNQAQEQNTWDDDHLWNFDVTVWDSS